ncbi:TOG array regulator of axonemal microtubules protein 2-like [Strigops habroptila]|uniref:TOG array regulator of axonemal microtubules protein 2-like n=1 Tax=Strigops habroptila TaxID=2489341 RepID=UPI0011CF01A5|nr:TOG array regulator of axonemal microtubules protein 2-like [Strigops habroptila]
MRTRAAEWILLITWIMHLIFNSKERTLQDSFGCFLGVCPSPAGARYVDISAAYSWGSKPCWAPLPPSDHKFCGILNLRAGCGTHLDWGAVSVCAMFRFAQGAVAQLRVPRGWLGAGASNEPDIREVSGPMPVCTPIDVSAATAPDSVGCGEKSERGDDQEARPFPDAQQGLLSTLTWLSSDDWEEKTKGLFSVRRLAICHSEVLLSRLHDVSLAVTKEVNNLRSKVSLLAISALGELFRTMKKHMDPVVDEATRVLLQRMGNCSMSIQKAANQCLGIMVGNVTPARAMTALMASGIQHCNVLVRKCAAEHLLTTMELIGAQKLLSGSRYSTDLLVRALVKLAQDCHQDTRFYGRKMLNILMSHQKFEKYLKQSIPSRDLEDVMATIRQKTVHHTSVQAAPQPETPETQPFPPETEDFMELYRLLTAEDFQSRLEGVQLLQDHCKSSPWFIFTNIIQIFGVFVLRIQDCNKKVKQQALEALSWMTSVLRDALHPVLVSLVEAVTDNLNSKHPGISAAAVKALEAFIAQLDNTLLLQTLAQRVHYLRGQALLDVTEHLSGIAHFSQSPFLSQEVFRGNI